MLKPFIFWNRFAETGFLPVTERPIVRGIIVTIPDAWTPTPRNKGQWCIKAVGGRGKRCFCRRELITSYATESAGQRKNGRFTLPLQCI